MFVDANLHQMSRPQVTVRLTGAAQADDPSGIRSQSLDWLPILPLPAVLRHRTELAIRFR
jgi:hypothetical protein